MFGMLDYRAHKLYLILFGIPWLILRWIAIIGLPFAWYGIGLNLASNRILQILVSLVAAFVGEIVWLLVVTLLNKLFLFLFGLLVDVIPANGRTKDEAKLVVQSGEQAIFQLTLAKKHPSKWSDDDVALSNKGFFNFFFHKEIANRFDRVREYYSDKPELPVEYELDKYLADNGLKVGLLEKIVTNQAYRGMVICYGLLLYLLLLNPFKN